MKNDINDRLSYSEDVESPFLPASHDVGHQARKKPLTLLPLIALIFFEVSGGPFGTEVSHQGPSAGTWLSKAAVSSEEPCSSFQAACEAGAI